MYFAIEYLLVIQFFLTKNWFSLHVGDFLSLKGTVKEKWKGVKDKTWESQELNDTYKTSIYLMFLSREIDIKLCQNYTKKDICDILYKSCSIKQIIFINYAKPIWKRLIGIFQNLRLSGFIPYPLLFFFILFLLFHLSIIFC